MRRPHAKRYLGMTAPQLFVLGIILLVLCCIFVGGYSYLNSIVAAAYQLPNLPGVNETPSLTPIPSATPRPTITPSPTATTYASLIPSGWQQFLSTTTPLMEIWLPPNYIVATDMIDTIPVYVIEDGQSALALKDITASPYMLYTSFEVVSRPVFGANLDAMLDAQFGTLMQQGRLLERDEFKIGIYSARKMVVDINLGGTEAGLVFYSVQVGKNIWYISFATPFNELSSRISTFDQTARTFRIVEP